jgi:hypothetical protein
MENDRRGHQEHRDRQEAHPASPARVKPHRTDHPLLDGLRWLISPVITWWTFMGSVPYLVYLAYLMIAALIVLQFVRILVTCFLGK